MKAINVVGSLFDLFDDEIGDESTGWSPILWIRVIKRKDGKLDFVKGNRKLLNKAHNTLFSK